MHVLHVNVVLSLGPDQFISLLILSADTDLSLIYQYLRICLRISADILFNN